ncbi:MAG: hypothetical protein AAFZ63_19035 [Bacteroidota bacterium]
MKIKVILWLCATLLFTTSMFSQAVDLTQEGAFAVKDITFYSSTYPGNQGWVRMKNDDNSAVSIVSSLSTKAWDDFGEVAKPVTYISGYSINVEANILVDCPGLELGDDPTIFVRGVCSNTANYNLPIRQATILNDFFIRYEKTNAEMSFPDLVVNHFENFEIKWFVALDATAPDEDWVSAGITTTELYVVHGIPDMIYINPGGDPSLATQPFHTLIHLGCKNAQGKSNPQEIVDAIYQEFMDQDVRPYGGSDLPMTYWGPNSAPEPSCFSTYGLLTYLDGRCAAWAEFFQDIIKMQGIEESVIYSVNWNYILNDSDFIRMGMARSAFFGDEANNVQFVGWNHPVTGELGVRADFLVKHWSITEEDVFIIHEYNPSNIDVITLDNGNEIHRREEDGVIGQGNTDPRSYFLTHAIVEYADFFYDPSYGTSKNASSNAWENQSLDAFGGRARYTTVNPEGIQVMHELYWLSALNTTSLQTNFVPND